jgi:hypothetical protein
VKVDHCWSEFVGQQPYLGFTRSVSLLRVKVMGVFCYVDGLPDDPGTAGRPGGYRPLQTTLTKSMLRFV